MPIGAADAKNLEAAYWHSMPTYGAYLEHQAIFYLQFKQKTCIFRKFWIIGLLKMKWWQVLLQTFFASVLERFLKL